MRTCASLEELVAGVADEGPGHLVRRADGCGEGGVGPVGEVGGIQIFYPCIIAVC